MKKNSLHILLTVALVFMPACNGKAARTESSPDPIQSIVAPVANPGSLRAMEKAKEYVKNNPENADAHYRLGTAYIDVFMYEEAVKSHINAIRINPDHADAHNSLGIAYGGLGMYREAVEDFKQAVRIRTDYAEAYKNMGLAYEKLHMPDDASKA